jgi:hypothetical protein
MTVYKFGTVFSYNDKVYIYLVPDGDQIYAALVLNLPESKMLDDAYKRKVRTNPDSPVLDGLLYSFVILETEELKARAAHFLSAGKQRFDPPFTTLEITLTAKDLKQLKDEITKERCAIIRLKQLVKGIKI